MATATPLFAKMVSACEIALLFCIAGAIQTKSSKLFFLQAFTKAFACSGAFDRLLISKRCIPILSWSIRLSAN